MTAVPRSLIAALAALATAAARPLSALQAAGHQTHGYVWMFVVLASTPYLLLAIVGGGIYRAKKREREREVERMIAEQHTWESARDG